MINNQSPRYHGPVALARPGGQPEHLWREVGAQVQVVMSRSEELGRAASPKAQTSKASLIQEIKRATSSLISLCKKFDQLQQKSLEMVAAFSQALKPLFGGLVSGAVPQTATYAVDPASLKEMKEIVNRSWQAAMQELTPLNEVPLTAAAREQQIQGLTQIKNTAPNPALRSEAAARLQALYASSPEPTRPPLKVTVRRQAENSYPPMPRAQNTARGLLKRHPDPPAGHGVVRKARVQPRPTNAAVAPGAPPAPTLGAPALGETPGVAARQRQLQKKQVSTPANVKSKWPEADYKDLKLGGKFSKLFDASGHGYVMTQTITRGSFGKVRLAVAIDGSTYAVKELRHVSKAGTDKWLQPKTRASSTKDVSREFAVTTYLRDNIEAHLQHLDRLPQEAPASMKRLRSGTSPFKLQAMVYDQTRNKSYYVMNRDSGDIHQLHGQLSEPMRHAAALSLAVQGFSELGVMHSSLKFAHLDLSMGNIFYTQTGQIKLMDFGMARPLDTDGNANVSGLAYTVNTPEHIALLTPGNTRPRMGRAADVFAMAVLVVKMAAAPGAVDPFANNFQAPELKNLPRHLQLARMFDAFEQWKVACRDPRTNQFSPSLSNNFPSSPFTLFFRGLAAADPALCSHLIDHVMTLKPDERPRSADVAVTMGHAAARQDVALGALQKAISLAANPPRTTQMIDKARAYGVWEIGHAAQMAQQPSPHRRGQPRPLPPLRA